MYYESKVKRDVGKKIAAAYQRSQSKNKKMNL